MLFQGFGDQVFQLGLDLCFLSVPPALENRGVAHLLAFHHIVQLTLVFKFLGVFPTELRGNCFAGEFENPQGLFVHALKDVLFDRFSDQASLIPQPGIRPEEGRRKTQKEEYGQNFSHGLIDNSKDRKSADIHKALI